MRITKKLYKQAKPKTENINLSEDEIYSDDQLIILLDGASGLGARNTTKTGKIKSDARLYSYNLAKVLPKVYDKRRDIYKSLDESFDLLKEKYDKLAIEDNVPNYRLPSATGTILEITDNELIFYYLGDIKTLVLLKNGEVIKVQDNKLSTLDENVFIATRKVSKDKNIPFKKALQEVWNIVIQNREKMNTDSGYYIFSFDKSALDQLNQKRFIKKEVAEIIMMSDGFYTVYNDETKDLFEIIKSSKKEDLIKHIEKELKVDKDYEKYNRFKDIDDISMIHIKND